MLNNWEHVYEPHTNVIKAQWDKHLKHEFHAKSYFLNHTFFYSDKYFEKYRIIQVLLDLFDIRGICSDLTKDIKEMQVYRDWQENFSQ